MKNFLLSFSIMFLISACSSTGTSNSTSSLSNEDITKGCRGMASYMADSGIGGGNICQKKDAKSSHTREFLYRQSH